MNPQGSDLIDTAYFTALTARVNAIDTCAELQDAVNKAFASMQGQVTGIEDQLAVLAPMIGLLTLNPTDLPGVITFLDTFVTKVLTPYLAPYTTYVAQKAAILVQIADLGTAIASAASRIDSCTISVPAIV